VQRLRPLAITGTLAVVSVGLLMLAVGFDWLGPDVGRGANFCEAARLGAVKQPANSWSNLGFVVAGLLIAWRVSSTSLMPVALQIFYACVVVLLGPASAAMHATQSSLGGHLDLLSMYLIAGFAAAYAWVRLVRRGPGWFFVAYGACVLACELAGLWTRPVPVVQFAGNVAFGLLLLTAVVIETRLWRRGESRRTIGFGFAALASMLVAFFIWIMSQHGWCAPHSLVQGHAAWHMLCATAAYLLFCLYASERAVTSVEQPGPP
jgi:Ceramidase